MDACRQSASIRKMKTEDEKAIGRIYSLITHDAEPVDLKGFIEEQVRHADDSACFVAEADGKVVGFMFSYALMFGFGVKKSAWIANMGVDPKYMGQGIGAQLAKSTFDFFKSKGIGSIYTSVRWDATDVLSFFKTLGFKKSNFINLRISVD